jgi:methylenetetrahydrofolate dehydrogenase (NADP+)/methenyltetrahydrofolate cyclohydrolase
VPCTYKGIIRLLDYYCIDIEGKECVIVGRSNIVGKPVAAELLRRNGTVTICHSKTEELREHTMRADILICAVGQPKFFDLTYIMPGTNVIDVGIHRLEDGTLCGDVNMEDFEDDYISITPVPGGVGPMTITTLLQNTLMAAEKHFNN